MVGQEPQKLNDLEVVEELGAQREDDELVIYDYPGFVELLDCHEKGDYLPDND